MLVISAMRWIYSAGRGMLSAHPSSVVQKAVDANRASFQFTSRVSTTTSAVRGIFHGELLAHLTIYWWLYEAVGQVNLDQPISWPIVKYLNISKSTAITPLRERQITKTLSIDPSLKQITKKVRDFPHNALGSYFLPSSQASSLWNQKVSRRPRSRHLRWFEWRRNARR